jgi:hypothetical protein
MRTIVIYFIYKSLALVAFQPHPGRARLEMRLDKMLLQQAMAPRQFQPARIFRHQQVIQFRIAVLVGRTDGKVIRVVDQAPGQLVQLFQEGKSESAKAARNLLFDLRPLPMPMNCQKMGSLLAPAQLLFRRRLVARAAIGHEHDVHGQLGGDGPRALAATGIGK